MWACIKPPVGKRLREMGKEKTSVFMSLGTGEGKNHEHLNFQIFNQRKLNLECSPCLIFSRMEI